jgi:hypothetical protein
MMGMRQACTHDFKEDESMDKKDLRELGVMLAAVFTGTAVTKGIRNACGKDAVGTIGGFLAGGLASLGIVQVASRIGLVGNNENPTEEVEEEPEAEEA